ncbi:MAG TPA: SURF1 family protein [Nocardioides sp.]|nr:SURF1 family protein [Nocardioides sp.]
MPSRARSPLFLLGRRWLLLLVTVLVLAYACLLLGRWQWHRLEGKKTGNAIIRANQKESPRPVDQVLRHDVDPPSSDQYAVVSATGTYDASKTVIIRYQTRDAASGVDVVVPLMTSSGTALLVDRGWVQTSNQGLTDASQVPAPPSGKVTVTGWVRQDAGGGAAQVVDASARAISSAQIEPAIGVPVYGGFVQLLTESPQPTTPLRGADPPDLSNGPHFFYALQWWFFGILAIFGYVYLAWEEATGRADLRRAQQPAKKPASPGPGSGGSERPHDAAVHGEHRPADERRGRAEQERRGTAEL